MDKCNCWATHDGPSYFCPLHGEIKNELVEAEQSQETPQADVTLNDLLCGRNPAEQRTEILDRMKYFYLQTDGSYKWPNSAEGDLLKMVYGLLTT